MDVVSQTRHRVAVPVYDGMTLFETGIVVEVMGARWPDVCGLTYDVRLCTVESRGAKVLGGGIVTAGEGMDFVRQADTVVISGSTDPLAQAPAELVEAIQDAWSAGARVASICTGAFILAQAGILEGRTVTTHWTNARALQDLYPTIKVDPRPIFIDDGRILSSGGSAAGIDLCLHIIRRDLGSDVANRVARRMVSSPYRDGGQAQFIESSVPNADSDSITESMAWISANLSAPLSVPMLAERASMSARTYSRRFREATGTSPMRWVISQRITSAMRLLETTDLTIEAVGRDVGFESAATFRHHFVNINATSPGAFRRRFRAAAVD